MTQSSKRHLALIASAKRAYAKEQEKHMDIMFRERPFLEDPSLPPKITYLDYERKESEAKLRRIAENLNKLLDNEYRIVQYDKPEEDIDF